MSIPRPRTRISALFISAALGVLPPAAKGQQPDVFNSQGQPQTRLNGGVQQNVQASDPMRCFGDAWRSVQNAVQAYQLALGGALNTSFACHTQAQPADLQACWPLLQQAKALIEQAAPIYERARVTPGNPGQQLNQQANALNRQSRTYLDRANTCYLPIYQKWFADEYRAGGAGQDTPNRPPLYPPTAPPPRPPGVPGPIASPYHPNAELNNTRPNRPRIYELPGSLLSYCYPDIRISVDIDAPNLHLQKGTVLRFTMTGQTQVEGDPRSPSATVEYTPQTGAGTYGTATHIWFRSPYFFSTNPNVPLTPSPTFGTRPATVDRDAGICLNGPAKDPNPSRQSDAVFTYFYINGINTPRTNNDWRGSCQSEHDTVAINLIDDPTVINPRIPRAQGRLANITVGNEVDRMYTLTCNPSGQDAWAAAWIAQNCSGNPGGIIALGCQLLRQVNRFRAGEGCGLTPGDVWECARQSMNLPPWAKQYLPGPKGFDIEGTAHDPLVLQIVNAILQSYQQEQAGQSKLRKYFIVVAHSQGNFFAEGVAYSLLHDAGQVGREIFLKRLGIVSLGSPTSYETLGAGDPSGMFTLSRIVHHTRADDAINIVTTINALLRQWNSNFSSKKPWNPNDPPLWPWPGWIPVRTLFGADQLAVPVPCNISRGYIAGQNCDPFTALFWQRLQYNAGNSVSNPELYTPLMNSHLLDNYLDAPTATRPGIYLAPDKLMPFAVSPRTAPVLNCIRQDLAQLKTNLLNGSSTPATSTCSTN